MHAEQNVSRGKTNTESAQSKGLGLVTQFPRRLFISEFNYHCPQSESNY